MSSEYYFFIVAVLLSRIFLYWKNDGALRCTNIIQAMIFEAILLIPLYSPRSCMALVPLLLVYHTLQFILQRKGTGLLPKRILEFFLLVLISSFIFGFFLSDTGFNRPVVHFLQMIIGHCALFPHVSAPFLKKAMIYFLGVLLLVNEMNNIIRYILNMLKTGPFSGDTADKEELDRGKIIGVMERMLFFFFVITNNYESIAFILTAKGISRFKEFDDKNFAEYVLIGTLLSSGLAIFCAVLTTEMVKAIVR